ncbi:unnamed protein product [Spirodela intermedia]|uniref:Uncharacterized protein n=1 Tax=Spirodela intermedia TaxID=51605 RepID=A0A7I8IL45_SPIIN|nr:unnamed protein product [Spirodela intermedia]CAA6658247.1 unnamed protein product [Spirodela intermedia]
MASIPCSIHSELSSSSSFAAATAAPPWGRLSLPPCSVSSGLPSAGGLRTPFLGLAKTPGGLRGSSGVRAEAGPGGGGGGGGLLKIWSSGIAFEMGGIYSRLDGASQIHSFGQRQRKRRANRRGGRGGRLFPPPPPEAAKRPVLTAREKLRAARVLSRYAVDSKSSAAPPTTTPAAPPPRKAEFGSRVLEAMRETDGGGKRRSGLPEAPSNLLDDSKRGLSKGGFIFDFPGNSDLLVIAFSFVFISTVMFATTFLVWKLGAIHFNEY